MPQPTLAQIGAAIRSYREKRGLSIEALAGEADLHTVSVSRIENGTQNLSWQVFTSLADALEVDVIDIVRLATDYPRT